MGGDFFTDVAGPIPFGGLDSTDPLASRSTTPIGSSSASGWRTTSASGVCFWHSFAWPGVGHVRHRAPSTGRGSPARATRWPPPATKMAVAFEFFAKLGVPYYCFHDRDVAPEGGRFAEFRANLDALADDAAGYQERTGVRAAVGHGQPVHPPALPGRRRHQPGPRGLRLRRRAGQAHARGDPAPRRRELRPVGRPRGLRHAAQHRPARARAPSSPGSCTSSPSTSTRSASSGTLLIEPKPMEPTKHQYDYDVATVHGFLVRHGLEGEYRVNIEANHATLAGHSFHHEVAVRRSPTGSSAASTPTAATRRTAGTPTSSRTRSRTSRCRCTRSCAAAASRPGGFNFDAKLRRQSIDRTDLFHAHIGGIDTLARALLVAADLVERGRAGRARGARYAGWDGALGTAHPRRHARRSQSLAREGRGRARSIRDRCRASRSCSRTSSTGRSGRPTRQRVEDRRRSLTRWASSSGSTSRRPRPRPSWSTRPATVRGVGVGRVRRSSVPQPLWSEQDPALWWDGAVAAIRSVLASTGRRRRRRGCRRADRPDARRSSCSTPPATVLRPAILWNDQRTGRRVRRDPRGGRPRAAHRDHRQRRADRVHRAQARLGPRPRARRLARGSPTSCCPKDFVRLRLTGEYALDKADGAGTHPVRPRRPRLVGRGPRRARDRPGLDAADLRGAGGHRDGHGRGGRRHRAACRDAGRRRRRRPVGQRRRRRRGRAGRRWPCRSGRPASCSRRPTGRSTSRAAGSTRSATPCPGAGT